METTPYVSLSLVLQHITYYYYFSFFILPILPTARRRGTAVAWTGNMTGNLLAHGFCFFFHRYCPRDKISARLACEPDWGPSYVIQRRGKDTIKAAWVN
jgi:hypothetical protein